MKLIETGKNGSKKMLFRCSGTEPGKMRKYLKSLGVHGLTSSCRSVRDFNALLISQGHKRLEVIKEENPTLFQPGHMPDNAIPLEPIKDMSETERNFWREHESGILTTDDVVKLRKIREKERQRAWEEEHFTRRTMYFRKKTYEKLIGYAHRNNVTVASIVQLALDEFFRDKKSDDFDYETDDIPYED